MCVVCVTVAGTVVVASQITPIQVLSDYTSSQKTLTSFTGSSSALSSKQRSEIKVLVDGSPEADAVVCTGLTLKGASRSVITTARARAKASCDYAKRLNPFLETTVVTRTTSSRTNAGRVTVQVRSLKDLSQDPTITKVTELTDLQACKTEDLTPLPHNSNGFPRPSTAFSGSVAGRILYVPIIFSDLPFTDTDLGKINRAAENVSKFFQTTSYGRVSLSFEILPRDLWVSMKKSTADYQLSENIPQKNNQQVVEDALALVNSSINFNLYDGVIVTSGYSQTIGAAQAFGALSFQTSNGIAKRVTLELGSGMGDHGVTAHELGHSLFALEDLYVFLNANRQSSSRPFPTENWDMMGNTSAKEFFGWNKFLMGWLEPNQVRCLTNQISSSHYIETIDSQSKKEKLILINLAPGITIAIEGRNAEYVRGVLVYKIDSRIRHGDGPIFVERLLSSGQQLTSDGWTIRINDQDSNGFLVQILKNSGF